MEKPKAITAAASKLARLIFVLLTKGKEHTDQGQKYCDEHYREHVARSLAKRARELGMDLVANSQPA